MRCPHCGGENPSEALYCGHRGRLLFAEVGEPPGRVEPPPAPATQRAPSGPGGCFIALLVVLVIIISVPCISFFHLLPRSQPSPPLERKPPPPRQRPRGGAGWLRARPYRHADSHLVCADADARSSVTPSAVLFEDNLVDNQHGWQPEPQARASFQDGTDMVEDAAADLKVPGGQKHFVSVPVGAPEFTDFEYEAQISANEGVDMFGIVFRLKDISNYYYIFWVKASGYALEKWIPGQSWGQQITGWLDLPAEIRGLRYHTFRVKAVGQSIALEVAGRRLGNVLDDFGDGGRIGVIAASG